MSTGDVGAIVERVWPDAKGPAFFVRLVAVRVFLETGATTIMTKDEAARVAIVRAF